MGLSDCSPSIPANQFHMGTTCPACQETIEIGQAIVTCRKCSAVHHETCWHHGKGCSAYACATMARRDPGSMIPEMVITQQEAAQATPPPARRKPWVAEPLERHLPPKPTRRSRLGIVACVCAGLACALLLFGVQAHEMAPMLGCMIAGMAGLVLGILSLVAITNGTAVCGGGLAATGTVLSSLLLMMAILGAGKVGERHRGEMRVRITANRSMPSEDALGQMQPSRARSMRANTVITCAAGFLSKYSVGSGIIIRRDGQEVYILTNRHVVNTEDDSPSLRVLFYNGEESQAHVEWSAPGEVDLAIIRCQSLTLPEDIAIQLAPSHPAQGDHVFAVGNPMSLYWSYTEGVISAVRQQAFEQRELTIYQTQTPINRGNSGGGLYNMRGELVGINTWTQDKAEAEGLSFAISAQSLLELLRADQQADMVTIAAPAAATATEDSTP